MDFITGMFKSMFNASTRRYKMRAQAKVRAKTVGKAQAKLLKGRAAIDHKVSKAQDAAFDVGQKKKGGKAVGPGGGGKKGAPGGGGGAGGGTGGERAPVGPPRGPVAGGAGPQAQAAGGPPRGAAVGAPRGGPPGQQGGVPGRAPVGPTQMQQQGAIDMGKGKRNKGQMPMGQMVGCMNCGSGLQPDWDMCPYCGAPAGQQAYAAAAPQMGYGGHQGGAAAQAADAGEKTMAINLDDLNKRQNRSVVGWIVAQNGNHRGQDFRLYDGKNLLGTAADCDIVITDPYLSAKHCTIRHENGNFVLIDLDSTNGTFVNQKRVSTMELIDNDTVRLGRTEFKFKALF